jgi:hypothetical protein
MLCQSLVYKEVTALFNLRDRELNSWLGLTSDGAYQAETDSEEKEGWSKALNW